MEGERNIQDVTKEYLTLFNAITDAQETLQALYASLLQAQQKAEEIYISEKQECL